MPSAETRDAIQWALATTLASLTLVGLVARFVVLPWIRSQLVQPLREARDYARPTGNGFAEEMRTGMREIKRDIGGIREEIRQERTERREADAELRRGAERLERAVETHARAQAAVWPAIEAIAKATPPTDD